MLESLRQNTVSAYMLNICRPELGGGGNVKGNKPEKGQGKFCRSGAKMHHCPGVIFSVHCKEAGMLRQNLLSGDIRPFGLVSMNKVPKAEIYSMDLP